MRRLKTVLAIMGFLNFGTLLSFPENAITTISFDEKNGEYAFDSGTNQADASVYGAVRTNGVSGNALQFDGLDDYVKIVHEPFMNTPTEVTVICWVKLINTSPYGGIISKVRGICADDICWELGFLTNRQVSFQIKPPVPNDVFTKAEAKTCVLDNQWHQLVGVFNGNLAPEERLKIYVDGKFEGQAKVNGSQLRTFNTPILIGRQNPSPFGEFVAGAIDEVRIYKQALDAREIESLFQEVAKRKLAPAGKIEVTFSKISRENLPEFICPVIKGQPNIDGILEPVWDDGLEFNSFYYPTFDRTFSEPGSIKFVSDGENLYLGFHFKKNPIFRPDLHLYLLPETPGNAILCYKFSGSNIITRGQGQPGDLTNTESRAKFATAETDDYLDGEVMVPLKEIYCANLTQLRFALCWTDASLGTCAVFPLIKGYRINRFENWAKLRFSKDAPLINILDFSTINHEGELTLGIKNPGNKKIRLALQLCAPTSKEALKEERIEVNAASSGKATVSRLSPLFLRRHDVQSFFLKITDRDDNRLYCISDLYSTAKIRCPKRLITGTWRNPADYYLGFNSDWINFQLLKDGPAPFEKGQLFLLGLKGETMFSGSSFGLASPPTIFYEYLESHFTSDEINDYLAKKIDGNPYSRRAYIITCPTYRGKIFRRDIELMKQAIDLGAYSFNFDDEVYNGEKLCFCERCEREFAEYLEINRPALKYIHPRIFEQAPYQHPDYHKAWTDFKCQKNVERFKIYRDELEKYMRTKGIKNKLILSDWVGGTYTVEAAKEEALHDFLSMSTYLDYFFPMLYLTPDAVGEGIRNIINIVKDRKKVIAGLTPGQTYCNDKDYPPVWVKYSIYEAILNGAVGFTFWTEDGFTAEKESYIAEAVNALAPVEDILMDGEIMSVSDDAAFYQISGFGKIRGIRKGDEAVILVSNYVAPNYVKPSVDVRLFFGATCELEALDLETGEVLGKLSRTQGRLSVSLTSERMARVIYVRKPLQNGTTSGIKNGDKMSNL